MIISCLDITDKTKPFSLFNMTMYGPTSAPLSSTSAAHVLLAKELKLLNTNLMDSLNSCLFWKDCGTDIIKPLQDSDGHTAILVFMDRLSKQGIFIPTVNEITAQQLANLFILHIFSKHGVLSHVTCDQGSKFISHFFHSLDQALDMKIHFTSGYHLEGNGQTKQLNQTLKQYLQTFCNYQQDNWSSLLPLGEFAYNNAPAASTRVSPFFANKGYHPNITVHPEHELAS